VERIVSTVTEFLQKRKMHIMGLEFIMRGLKPQITYDGFEECDLVIEAVIENIQLKQTIFAELERVCKKDCILATNTSTIDIDVVGQKTQAQDRILGLHFFSPAHVMPLLEIVRTKSTSSATLATSLVMSKNIEKTPVVVGNCVGFTANRIFFPYGQAAAFLVDHGIDPYRIDKAILAYGMPMGPFQMSDLSGLDVFVHVNTMINQAYGSRCYNSTLGHKLAASNRLGQKTKAGYYKYDGGRGGVPDASLAPLIEQARADAKQKEKQCDALLNLDRKLTNEQIVEIIMFPVVNESYRVLEEGHVIRASDVDVVSVMGYGYPAWRGGILFWAQQTGLRKICDRLRYLSQEFGAASPSIRSFFTPCPYLEKLAK